MMMMLCMRICISNLQKINFDIQYPVSYANRFQVFWLYSNTAIAIQSLKRLLPSIDCLRQAVFNLIIYSQYADDYGQLLEYLKTLSLGLNLRQPSVYLTIIASSIFQQSLLLSFKRSFISFA
ncbi:hypothetical protein T10_13012 [Trichinella papuae]|uniref:Uncharacterized protein n=1 Tax=Trichinella papuae TaxID=268474 RepID=A0A0V1ME71_9BILA|nr:hypothetical protein T10_13012 [Trichinella papuae]